MYMYNPCVEMDNILGMEVGNSYNGLYIHHFNLQEKCLVLVVLDLNVYCWLAGSQRLCLLILSTWMYHSVRGFSCGIAIYRLPWILNRLALL